MNNPATAIELLFEKIVVYTATTFELYKLQTIDKVAQLLAYLFAKFVIIIAVALSCFMASIGFALWLGNYFGNTYWGFYIVAALYLLIGLILALIQTKRIKMPIQNALITQLLENLP